MKVTRRHPTLPHPENRRLIEPAVSLRHVVRARGAVRWKKRPSTNPG